MKTKTKIEKQLKKKTNSELVETIIGMKKNEGWLQIAGIISGPRRNRIVVNLEKLNTEAKDGDAVLVPGKILSRGDIDKKLKYLVSLSISDDAREKLDKAKIKYHDLLEEIKKNPDAKGIKIIK